MHKCTPEQINASSFQSFDEKHDTDYSQSTTPSSHIRSIDRVLLAKIKELTDKMEEKQLRLEIQWNEKHAQTKMEYERLKEKMNAMSMELKSELHDLREIKDEGERLKNQISDLERSNKFIVIGSVILFFVCFFCIKNIK
eukprot:66589_1